MFNNPCKKARTTPTSEAIAKQPEINLLNQSFSENSAEISDSGIDYTVLREFLLFSTGNLLLPQLNIQEIDTPEYLTVSLRDKNIDTFQGVRENIQAH